MPLVISPVTTSTDLAEYSRLYYSVSSTGPLDRARFPQGKTAEAVAVEVKNDHTWFGQDKSLHIFCVRDTDVGNEMISVARWRLVEPDEQGNSFTHEPAPGENPEVLPYFFSQLDKGRIRVMGKGRKYWHLQILATKPEHERRGAGSMLIKVGIDLADQEGLQAFLTASKPGEPLYKRHGFEVAGTSDEMDLRQFGVDSVFRSSLMVRPSKTAL